MVDRTKYNQLLDDRHQIYEEIKGIQVAKNMLTEQLQIVSQQEKGNEGKVGELNQKLLELSQQLEKTIKERDFSNMELKSVENIMRQKDSIIEELEHEKQDEGYKVSDQQKSVEKLREDREKLLQDNTTLIETNKNLENNIHDLNSFLKDQKSQYETEKSKDLELIRYLQNPNSVHSSLQKAKNPAVFDLDISNKTADFQLSSEYKENTSLNSIKNITPSFYNEVPTYGKISKNRSKSRSRT
mmetsp:Transcript_25212/g.22342  ORF Transcript_25212/g.22342 Transcript_25212/m.22342 type:complete len:242 (+) Transcript_25212:214-939(+)